MFAFSFVSHRRLAQRNKFWKLPVRARRRTSHWWLAPPRDATRGSSDRRRSDAPPPVRPLSMILARKLDLQQSLRRALVTIEDKELALHIHNNQRLGLISAMLAIFIFGAFYGRYLPQNSLAEKASSEYAEIAVPTSELGAGHVVLLHAYMALTAAATILQLLVVVRTTMLCVLAPGLGLRGPEGSMTRAVLVLRRQSMINLHLFYAGYVCFCADAAVYLYILFEGDAVLPAPSLALIAASLVWAAVDATRVERRLRLP